MKLVAQFHSSIAAMVASRTAAVSIAYSDGAPGVEFAVTAPSDVAGAATAIVTAFDALTQAQRTHLGVGVKLVAVGETVLLLGATTDALASVASIGDVVGEVITAPASVDHVIIENYAVPPAAGYSPGQVAMVAAAAALLARNGS